MLDVSNALKYPGQAYPLKADFTVEPIEVMGDAVAFSGVSFSGRFFGAEETVTLEGTATAVAHSHCANCLAPVALPMKVDVSAVFSRKAANEEEFPLEGHEVDLLPPLRESLILALPMRFLCREDCLGLCPVCGQNRNTGLCTCPKGGEAANPFSALSSLFSDHNDEEV